MQIIYLLLSSAAFTFSRSFFKSGTDNRIHDEMLEQTMYSASVFDRLTELLLSN